MTATEAKALRAMVVDPSLFTIPYDMALLRGLRQAGVDARWVGRPLRALEMEEASAAQLDALYYRGIQDSAKGRGVMWKLRKAVSHLIGGVRLLRRARRGRFDVVHFQWTPLPAYDSWIMRRLARSLPVVLTVHDVEPYNGAPTSSLQRLGFNRIFQAASHLIVHTEPAKRMLQDHGVAEARIAVIPHGPLTLDNAAPVERRRPPGAPWRLVLFGRLQPYKGVDVLVEALGLMTPQDRARLQVVVAGEPLMPMEPILARIAELGLGRAIDLRPKRLEEAEIATLFAETDAFVFPYRQIQASGVLYLVAPYRRWLIASDLGVFADAIQDGRNGERVPPDAPQAWADAMLRSIGREPEDGFTVAMPGWDEIGRRTREVYHDLISRRSPGPSSPAVS